MILATLTAPAWLALLAGCAAACAGCRAAARWDNDRTERVD